MQTLEYAISRKKKPRQPAFWLAFAFAYLVGLVVLDITDDRFHERLTGFHNDGGIAFVSMFLSPVFVGTAAAMKAVWTRLNSIEFAVSFAIFAPLLVYLLCCLTVFFR